MSLAARFQWLAAAIVLLAIVGLWTGAGWESAWRWPAAGLLLLFVLEVVLAPLRRPLVARRLPEPLVLGETSTMHYQIENPLPRPLHIELAERLPRGLQGSDLRRRLCLAPGEQLVLEHRVLPQSLLTEPFEALRLRVLGAAGLVWWPSRLDASAQARVVPQRISGAELNSGNRHGGHIEQLRNGTGTELLSMREYQHGDPPRSVDWKATARRGRAIVRVFGEETQLELCILLDCGRRSRLVAGRMDRLHVGINLASRLGQLAISQGDSVSLITYDSEVRLELHGLRHARGLQHLHKALCSVRSANSDASPLTAALAADRHLKRRALVVILSELESPQAAGQLLRAVQLLRRRHLPLLATCPDEALLHWPERGTEAWRQPYRQLAVDELLHSSRVAREKLRALGAQIVEARAEQLDAALLQRYAFLRQRRRV